MSVHHADPEYVARLEAENARLRARIGRLRKAVNWLRGAYHDNGGEAPAHHGTVQECEVWECMRARAILEEQAELDHRDLDPGDGDALVGRAAREMGRDRPRTR
jgi:hypothetical protein